MNAPSNERSLGELFGELAHETGALVRQEVQLAASEAGAKTRHAAKNVGIVAMGGAFVHAGFVFVLGAIVFALSTMIPLWMAAGVVGVTCCVAGYMVVQKGLLSLERLDPVPRQTLRTLEQTKQWAKEQMP